MDLEELKVKRHNAMVRTIGMLEDNYIRLGRPGFDYKNKNFWEFMEILVDTWRIAYPLEVIEWLETREFDLATEKTVQEQVRQGLHKSFAVPMGLFRMIKTYWSNADLLDKKFGQKFKSKFPIFKNSKF